MNSLCSVPFAKRRHQTKLAASETLQIIRMLWRWSELLLLATLPHFCDSNGKQFVVGTANKRTVNRSAAIDRTDKRSAMERNEKWTTWQMTKGMKAASAKLCESNPFVVGVVVVRAHSSIDRVCSLFATICLRRKFLCYVCYPHPRRIADGQLLHRGRTVRVLTDFSHWSSSSSGDANENAASQQIISCIKHHLHNYFTLLFIVTVGFVLHRFLLVASNRPGKSTGTTLNFAG